jgi:hypothetical protein
MGKLQMRIRQTAGLEHADAPQGTGKDSDTPFGTGMEKPITHAPPRRWFWIAIACRGEHYKEWVAFAIEQSFSLGGIRCSSPSSLVVG